MLERRPKCNLINVFVGLLTVDHEVASMMHMRRLWFCNITNLLGLPPSRINL